MRRQRGRTETFLERSVEVAKALCVVLGPLAGMPGRSVGDSSDVIADYNR